jgi:hypothetical protein
MAANLTPLMHTFVHLFVGIIAMIALGLEGWPAVIFILATVAIDLDHIIELFQGISNIKKNHIWDIGSFRKANYDGYQRSMHIFHTFEVIIALFIAARYYVPLLYVAYGFAIHLVTDGWGNFWNRNIKKKGGSDWFKFWFLAYYIKKGSVFNR